MSNPEVCPECGAKQKEDDGGKNWKIYECLTFIHGGEIYNRSSQCYDRQIAQLKARVAKLERVAEAVKELRLHMLHNSFPGLTASDIWKRVLKSLKDLEACDVPQL